VAVSPRHDHDVWAGHLYDGEASRSRAGLVAVCDRDDAKGSKDMKDIDDDTGAFNMSNVILGMMESMQPMFDAGTGLKARLESEGWSAEAAEKMAMTLVIEMITKALRG
jgi:hypothetical protein